MQALVFLNVLIASLSMGAGETHHTLSTANSAVEFTVGEKGVVVSRWDATKESRRHWIAAEPLVPVWSITIQQSTGEHSTIAAFDGPAVVREASPTRLAVVWTGLTPGKLDVLMTVSVRGDDLIWELEAAVQAENCALWDITFPEIGPIASAENVHSITTYGWGAIHDDLMHCPRFEGDYPSAQCSMPFVAVSDGRAGLYMAAEDSAGYPFRLLVGKREGTSAVTLGLRHDIPGMGTAKTYKIPYPVVTTPYAGDWYEAARIYRKAAQHTPWGAIAPLHERTGIPAWLTNTDLWYIGACDSEESAAKIIDFAKYFDVPVSAHVYTWHEIPFDDHYPEYFPAKPGFRSAVAKVQAAGVSVMPYINGRLWDAATTSWKEKNAQEAAALDAKGECYKEVYGSKVPLTPMCPATALWKDTVVHLVDRLVNEEGVRGVYVDQISAASPKRCFAPNHGHPAGGGTSWIQGYRDLVQKCRAVLPPGAIVTTEENADPWNDVLDAFLMVNTQARGGTIAPIYPAVYGGRAVSFGFQYLSGEDFKARYPLRLKFAQAFTFGAQLGWVGPAILEESNATEAAFLKQLCQARHGARDALQFGELLPPVEVQSDATVSWAEEEKGVPKTRTAKAVLASAWLTPEGKRKLAIVNVSDADQAVTLTLDARHTGKLKASKVALQTNTGESKAVLHRNRNGVCRGPLTIPQRNGFVLEIVPSK